MSSVLFFLYSCLLPHSNHLRLSFLSFHFIVSFTPCFTTIQLYTVSKVIISSIQDQFPIRRWEMHDMAFATGILEQYDTNTSKCFQSTYPRLQVINASLLALSWCSMMIFIALCSWPIFYSLCCKCYVGLMASASGTTSTLFQLVQLASSTLLTLSSSLTRPSSRIPGIKPTDVWLLFTIFCRDSPETLWTLRELHTLKGKSALNMCILTKIWQNPTKLSGKLAF